MIDDFLALATVTMKSFIETFSGELPDAESNEYKFAVSILGESSFDILLKMTDKHFII